MPTPEDPLFELEGLIQLPENGAVKTRKVYSYTVVFRSLVLRETIDLFVAPTSPLPLEATPLNEFMGRFNPNKRFHNRNFHGGAGINRFENRRYWDDLTLGYLNFTEIIPGSASIQQNLVVSIRDRETMERYAKSPIHLAAIPLQTERVIMAYFFPNADIAQRVADYHKDKQADPRVKIPLLDELTFSIPKDIVEKLDSDRATIDSILGVE